MEVPPRVLRLPPGRVSRPRPGWHLLPAGTYSQNMAVANVSPPTLDLLGIRAGDRNLVGVILTADGAPVDLTGQTVEAQARAKASDPEPAIVAVCTVTDAPGGRLEMAWPGDDVRAVFSNGNAGLVAWRGVWDLQLVPAGGGDPLTVLAGVFAADLDVTR